MPGSFGTLEAAQTDGEYKALVCILLEGGADAFNMVVPATESAYEKYKNAREKIALPRDSLLPIAHRNENGLNPLHYGMRNNMGRMQELFNDKNLAIVANVGTLTAPVTPEEVENGAPVPFELFAHNTQRAQWMYGDATGSSHTGWAARCADLFYPTPNPYFNINVSDINPLLQAGGAAQAVTFNEAYISPDTMRYYGFGPEAGGSAFGNLYQDIYEAMREDGNLMIREFAKRRVEELERPDRLSGLFDHVMEFEGFDNGVHETGRALGRQLELVAQILSVREYFPGARKRQIFFVVHHGWDTHDSDNEHQAGYLSDSLGAFWDALVKMGIERNVTTLTLSDFGRTIGSNHAGTDHGWGSYAFVMGGSVAGGEIYGKMPSIETDSPDAWAGRVVPTTSMETYLSTLVKWLGADGSELQKLFPNLAAFGSDDLGFMR